MPEDLVTAVPAADLLSRPPGELPGTVTAKAMEATQTAQFLNDQVALRAQVSGLETNGLQAQAVVNPDTGAFVGVRAADTAQK